MDRLKNYARLTRINRPIGIFLLLWPTLCALWIAAGGFPGWTLFLVFVAGTVLMRSAGCAVNDFADRDIDLHVARTKDRPLTTGKITSKEALLIFATLSVCAFLLLLLTNTKTILLSFIGLFLAVIYPFSKRFTRLPQLFLGAAFSWGIPMAYAAVGEPLGTTTWLLFIASVLWALVYDTMYAMVDREDDLKIGIRSTAILFGNADIIIITTIQLVVLCIWVLVGWLGQMSLFYYAGLLLAFGFAVYQYTLVQNREPQKCFAAFLNQNYLGMAIFVGVVLHYRLSL